MITIRKSSTADTRRRNARSIALPRPVPYAVHSGAAKRHAGWNGQLVVERRHREANPQAKYSDKSIIRGP